MKIRDDGTKLVVSSSTEAAKGFALVGGALSVVSLLLVAAALASPPQQVSIDCARARGTCEFRDADRHQTVPIGEVTRLEVHYNSRTSSAGSSDQLMVLLRNSERLSLGAVTTDAATITGFRTTAADANAFLADAARPAFVTSFVTSGTDWSRLGGITLSTLFVALYGVYAWTNRRITLDRGARTLRVEAWRKFRAVSTTDISLADVRGLRITGESNTWVTLVTSSGEVDLLTVPRMAGYRRDVQRVVGELARATGVQPEFQGAQQGFWGMG